MGVEVEGRDSPSTDPTSVRKAVIIIRPVLDDLAMMLTSRVTTWKSVGEDSVTSADAPALRCFAFTALVHDFCIRTSRHCCMEILVVYQ